MSSKNINKITRIKKIFIILIFIFLSIVLLLSNVFVTISDKRRLPNLQSSKSELAIRGNILSEDNFKISSSIKLYKATIDTRFLDIKKKSLFIKLFSIYSDIPEAKIKEKIDDSLRNPGSIVLSYNIDSKTAKNLKELGFKLRHLDVFKSIQINDNKILRGLNINESGEKRLYSYEDTLTPVIGYIRKYETKDGKTKVNGIKGLEKSYNNILNNTKDGTLKGTRDVLSYISFNKDSIIQNRVDGADLILNIPLRLQKNLELMIDGFKTKLGADEIIVSIMESNTGKIKALASSNRFDPGLIRQSDIPYLDVSAIEFLFEPGSIIKPISIALVMDKDRIKENELFNAYNGFGKINSKGEYPRGRYKLGRYTIGDDHQFTKRFLTVDDIFVHSSNIGTLQLAQRLSGKEMYEGLKTFGITEKTQIDLPYEKVGVMPTIRQFSAGESKGEDNVFKATISYGQGMTSTFMQMLKAYSVFNNEGVMVTPKIVQSLLVDDNKLSLDDDTNTKVISTKTANEIKRLLIKTVNKGTGINTQIEGIEIGGKTGTAQIARHGKYQDIYISSFFGFANDKERKYTIGVTVINPISTGKYWYYHYASWSAVPLFKEAVNNLIKLNYLSKSSEN
ncbi:MAG: penicillin-binding protein 2 [Arcobacter sp.]|uniref:peptidoglycan D,D-transpeptidase FtsI family protein n=1 Tax=uncultured Arcobacter sp. TaxID=165434 RepID=UPI000CC9F1DE|nr:penicillin-binding protein 2 [uncultured Arcobacter sp.]PLY10565.1 MAG: penicillin-binding protein 2 [Arcobacter sp.]